MKTLSLNIETAGIPELLNQLPEPTVALGNTKDPALIQKKKDEARGKQLTRMALDPLFGRVLCATLAVRKPGENGVAGEIKAVTAFSADHGEPKLLAWIWKQLVGTADDAQVRLVTFNGAEFDIPFLLMRSLVHHVPCPHIVTNKYKVLDPHESHCDVMRVLQELHGDRLGLTRNLSFYVRQLLGEDWPYADLDQTKLAEAPRDTAKALCEWNATRTLALHELLIQHLA